MGCQGKVFGDIGATVGAQATAFEVPVEQGSGLMATPFADIVTLVLTSVTFSDSFT